MRPKNVKQQASPFIDGPEVEPADGYKPDGRYFTRAFLEKGKRQKLKSQ